MSSLNKTDLERFSWEKMSPGIEEKIKRKKKRAFFVRWKYIGGIAIVFLFINWGIQFIGTSENAPFFDQNEIRQTAIPVSEKLNSKDSHIKDVISKKEERQSSFNESGDIQLSIKEKFDGQRTYELTVSSQENKNKIEAYNKGIENEVIRHSQNKANIIKEEFRETKSDGHIAEDQFKSNGFQSIGLEKQENTSAVEELDTIDERSEVSTVLLKSYVFHLNNNQYKVDVNKSTVSSTPIFRRPRGFQAVELSYNFNSLTRHPHQTGFGNGYSLGYWFTIFGGHHAGFQYNYQNLRYQFLNNTENTISDNLHEMYNVPIYYSYKLGINKTVLAVETGLCINVFRQSKGEISAIDNEIAIFNIEKANYFNRRVNTSIILRGKIERRIYKSLGLFVRGGVDIANDNWYKDDSFEIKPIIYNLDIGTYVEF